MALTHWTTDSGLVVAEHASDEVAIGRALKQFDGRLTLQFRPPYYVVVCEVNDHYAPVVATWMDLQGKPLPLSSGLLEKVQAWHVGARNRPETVDEHNAKRQVEIENDRARDLEALRDDHRAKLTRGRVAVSISTRPRKRGWQRNLSAPQSGKATQ